MSQRSRRGVKSEVWDAAEGTKLCLGCQMHKGLDDFYPSDMTGSGRRSRCKECYVRDQGRRERGEPVEPGPVPAHRVIRADGTKLCSICQDVKTLATSFYVKADGRYYPHCKECHSEMVSQWRVRNGLPPLKRTYRNVVTGDTKSCSRCKEVKSLATGFYQRKGGHYYAHCRRCHAAMSSHLRAQTPPAAPNRAVGDSAVRFN